MPDLRRLVPGHDAVVFAHAPGYVGYDRYDDLVAQHAVSHHFVADDSGAREVRTPWRYVWPSELDLMARLAGLGSPIGGLTGTDRLSPARAPHTSPSGARSDRPTRGCKRIAPPFNCGFRQLEL